MLESQPCNQAALEQTGLKHRVYLPPSDGLTSQPVVLLVHGRAGNDSLMWTFSKTFAKHKPITITPQAVLDDPLGGFSWWEVEPRGSPPLSAKEGLAKLLPAIIRLEQFVRALPAVYSADPSRVHAVGFSQGAALVAALSLKSPRCFSSVAMLAGFLPRVVIESDSYISSKFTSGAEKPPPYFIYHGTKDEILPLEKANYAKSHLETLGAKVTFYTEEVGHKVGSQGMKELARWFDQVWGGA